jgi:iron only hydrogenase large subunit-like protein
MMHKGISDVDAVMTIRELARLIRLYGIDVTNSDMEPADEPLSGSSSAAALAEVSGGMTESILRSLFYLKLGIEPEKQLMKKIRLGGSFRELTLQIGEDEVSVAVVDGLTGLENMKQSLASGKKYDLIEVMVCPGGCINGAGLPNGYSKNDRRGRARIIYQSDDADAISIPCKSPVLINLYEKHIKENSEIADKKIFHTHFEKRIVLL